MKRDWSAPSYSLKVLPRGGRLPEGVRVELSPAKGKLIKDEPRTLIWRDVLSDGREIVVKLYRRALTLWFRRFIFGFRAKREFDGLTMLEKLGIPCSIPLFWCFGYFDLYGFVEMLVTEWVAHSQPLGALLRTRSETGNGLDLSTLFSDMARMHRAGLHHGMLRTRNILVKNDAERPVFVFIDMPRFHYCLRDIRGTRMALYDLMLLCEGVLPYFPEDKMLVWLSAYGIPDSKKIDLLFRLKRFRSTRFLRRVMGAEFNVRIGTANLFSFQSHNVMETNRN